MLAERDGERGKVGRHPYRDDQVKTHSPPFLLSGFWAHMPPHVSQTSASGTHTMPLAMCDPLALTTTPLAGPLFIKN